MHSNHLTLASYKVIIRIICDPSIPSGMSLDGKVLKEQTAIQFAITLDVIWNLRNQVIHGDHKIKIIATINMLESIIMEHVLSLKEPDSLEDRGRVLWEAPTFAVIKNNVDAAIFVDKSVIAAVARDYKGELIKAWAKTPEYKYPKKDIDCILIKFKLQDIPKTRPISLNLLM